MALNIKDASLICRLPFVIGYSRPVSSSVLLLLLFILKNLADRQSEGVTGRVGVEESYKQVIVAMRRREEKGRAVGAALFWNLGYLAG